MRFGPGVLGLAAGLSLAVGPALAEEASGLEAGGLRAAVFAHPAAQARLALAPVGLADAPPRLPDGVARTSIDHAFTRTSLTGSLGFLCGLDERLDAHGAMGAFGADPHGRFVGARLHMSLR